MWRVPILASTGLFSIKPLLPNRGPPLSVNSAIRCGDIHAFCSTSVGFSNDPRKLSGARRRTARARFAGGDKKGGWIYYEAIMYTKLIKWFAQTRVGGWMFLNVFDKIDKPLMRLTNARLSTGIGTALSKNAILLTCTGAKSGVERDVALLCTPSGDDIVLVASRTGHANNPGWYYNLKAHPHCVVRFRGKKFACVAKEAKGAQREELWKLATEQYPGYDTYATRTARVIPVMLLVAAP